MARTEFQVDRNLWPCADCDTEFQGYGAHHDHDCGPDYYRCRACGQEVQGFHASQDIDCCDNRNMQRIDVSDEVILTVTAN